MRIIVQFIGQAVGVIAMHYRDKNIRLPFRMWLFPLPALLSIAIWLFIFCTSDWQYIAGAFGVISLGIILFMFRAKAQQAWPFASKSINQEA